MSLFRFTFFHRFAAFLALLAILVPVGTSLVHSPFPASVAAQSFIHICGLDSHAKQDPGKDPAHKLPSCPICQSLHLLSGGFVPPAPILLAATPPAAAPALPALADLLVKRSLTHQARSRAPPSFLA